MQLRGKFQIALHPSISQQLRLRLLQITISRFQRSVLFLQFRNLTLHRIAQIGLGPAQQRHGQRWTGRQHLLKHFARDFNHRGGRNRRDRSRARRILE